MDQRLLHQKRKALSDEVGGLEVTLQTDAKALSAAADDFSDKAEKLQQQTLLAKATSSKAATEGTEPAYRY